MSKSIQDTFNLLNNTILPMIGEYNNKLEKLANDVEHLKNAHNVDREVVHNLSNNLEKLGILIDKNDLSGLIGNANKEQKEAPVKTSRKKPQINSVENNKKEDKKEDKKEEKDKSKSKKNESESESESESEVDGLKDKLSEPAVKAESTTKSEKPKKSTKSSIKEKPEKKINKCEYFKLMYDANPKYFDKFIGNAKDKILEDNKKTIESYVTTQQKNVYIRTLFYNYMRDNFNNDLQNMKTAYINDEKNKNVKLLTSD